MQSEHELCKIAMKHLFASGVNRIKVDNGPNGHHLSLKCQEEIKKKLTASSFEDVMAWVYCWLTRLNGEKKVPPKTASEEAASVIETQPAEQPAIGAAADQPVPLVVDLCRDEQPAIGAAADHPVPLVVDLCSDDDDDESVLSKSSSLIIHDDELGDVNLKDYSDHIDGKLDLETLKKRVIKKNIPKRLRQTTLNATQLKVRSKPRVKVRTYRSKLKANKDSITISNGKAHDEPTKAVCSDRSELNANEDSIPTTADKAEDTPPTIRVRNDLLLTGKVLAPIEKTPIVYGPVNQPATSPDSINSAGNRKQKECDSTTADGQGLAKRQSLELVRTNPSVYLQLPEVQQLLDKVQHFSVGQGNYHALVLINHLRHSLQEREKIISNLYQN